jgi:hypothetical protein
MNQRGPVFIFVMHNHGAASHWPAAQRIAANIAKLPELLRKP